MARRKRQRTRLAQTTAEKKRGRLQDLYRHDDRVSPWAGTGYGFLQAVNTYEHHDSAIRGSSRSERNMLRAVTGQFGQLDRATWQTLQAVLAA